MINIQIASRISDKFLFFFVANNKDKKNAKKIPIVNTVFMRVPAPLICPLVMLNLRPFDCTKIFY